MKANTVGEGFVRLQLPSPKTGASVRSAELAGTAPTIGPRATHCPSVSPAMPQVHAARAKVGLALGR